MCRDTIYDDFLISNILKLQPNSIFTVVIWDRMLFDNVGGMDGRDESTALGNQGSQISIKNHFGLERSYTFQ